MLTAPPPRHKVEHKLKATIRALIQTLTTASVAIEPLFSTFLGESIVESLQQIFRYIEEDPNYELSAHQAKFVGAIITAVLLSSVNLIGDTLATDPAQEAAGFLDMFSLEKIKKLPKAQLASTVILSLAFTIGSFWVGGSADSVPIANGINHFLGDNWYADIAKYGVLGFVALLGATYYLMFGTRPLYAHMDDLVEIIKHPLEFLKRALKSPLRYGETAMVSISNAGYRAVAFMFIAIQVLEKVFGVNDGAFKTGFVITVGGLTAFQALVARTRQILMSMPEDQGLSWKEVLSATLHPGCPTPGSLLRNAMAIVQVAIRGGCIGYMAGFGLDYLMPTGLAYTIGAIPGVAFGAHKLWVEAYSRSAGIARERFSPITVEDSDSDDEDSSASMFESISTAYQQHPALQSSVLGINLVSRIARMLGFLAFVLGTFSFLHLNPPFEIVLALSVLLASNIIKGDAETYQAAMAENVGRFVTSFNCERAATEMHHSDETLPITAGVDIDSDEINDGVYESTVSGNLGSKGSWRSCCSPANVLAKIGAIPSATADFARAAIHASGDYSDEVVEKAHVKHVLKK